MSVGSTARERGVISIALVVLLALFQIVLLAMVSSGTRQSDLTARRVESIESFYAAEAGANMAVREIMLGTDLDADGGIGSISNNSVPGDDPALGDARFVAVSSTVGGTTTVIVTGRSGVASRRINFSVEVQ